MRSAVAAAKAVGEAAAAVAAPVGAGRMRAWRVHAYGGVGALQLDAARVPALRAPSDLLVRVHSSSLNPLDVAMIGGYGRTVLNTLRAVEAAARAGGSGAAGGVEFPLVAGRDFLGEVVRGGALTTTPRGAQVWGVLPPHRPGAHAQYVVAREQWTSPAPQRLGLSAGGALYAALSATSALRAGGLWGAGGATMARGKRVLLLGLGGAGAAALQLLAGGGARVVVGCAGDVRERALRLGAVEALDRHAPALDQLLVDSGPYDVILDMAGVGGVGAGARRWRFKRYVTLSSPLLQATDARGLAGGLAAAALELASQCWTAATATAATGPDNEGSCLPPHVRWAYFMPRADDIELLRRKADSGELSVWVDKVYPWWEAAAAYARQAEGHARGKLLLDFTATPTPTPTPTPTADLTHNQ